VPKLRLNATMPFSLIFHYGVYVYNFTIMLASVHINKEINK